MRTFTFRRRRRPAPAPRTAPARTAPASPPATRRRRRPLDARRWLRRASRWLLAPRCLVCDARGQADLDLCAACTADLPWNRDVCRRCGLPLDGESAHCGHCLLAPPPFTLVQSALRYAFPVDRLLPRFKFRGDLAAGDTLATLLMWSLDPGEMPQALVPVPLHRARLRERGYDQALELARRLSRDTGVPLLDDRLRRIRLTAPQSELGAAARRDNVFGAFALHGQGALPAHVALVDDVLTTGATVTECARVLLSAGVRRVDVWTLARA
jgi:ComF family protein